MFYNSIFGVKTDFAHYIYSLARIGAEGSGYICDLFHFLVLNIPKISSIWDQIRLIHCILIVSGPLASHIPDPSFGGAFQEVPHCLGLSDSG